MNIFKPLLDRRTRQGEMDEEKQQNQMKVDTHAKKKKTNNNM